MIKFYPFTKIQNEKGCIILKKKEIQRLNINSKLLKENNIPDFDKWLFIRYPDFHKILEQEINRTFGKTFNIKEEILEQYTKYFKEYCLEFENKK